VANRARLTARLMVSEQVLAAGASRRYISAGFPNKSCALTVSASRVSA